MSSDDHVISIDIVRGERPGLLAICIVWDAGRNTVYPAGNLLEANRERDRMLGYVNRGEDERQQSFKSQVVATPRASV